MVGNAAVIKREAVTLALDHAFGFELADVGSSAIEMQRRLRRADGRHRVRSCCAAQDSSLRLRRHSGPCPDLSLAQPKAARKSASGRTGPLIGISATDGLSFGF